MRVAGGAAWSGARLLGALLAALWTAACGAPDAAPGAKPAASAPEGAQASGAVWLQLEPEALAHVGVRVVPAEASALSPELLAYGRVLDPAPVAEAIANREAARAAADAAGRELARVTALARDRQNASARELEAARAAAARASADRELAEARVAALLGDAVPDLPGLARRLGRREVALVRIDVPGAEQRPLPERGASLAAYPEAGAPLEARYLGPAPDADPLRPGWSYLFLVTASPPPAGSPVRARLALAGEPLPGVRLPGGALLRSEGRLFVFVAGDAGRFERRAVTARVLADGGVFVSEGLAAGEPVVVEGAQQLLSAQRLAAGGGEAED